MKKIKEFCDHILRADTHFPDRVRTDFLPSPSKLVLVIISEYIYTLGLSPFSRLIGRDLGE